MNAFPNKEQTPSAGEIERIMRPLGYISWEVHRQVQVLFFSVGVLHLSAAMSYWVEANLAVSGEEPERAQMIWFLLRSPCIYVLDYLPEAIEHATGSVDARILALLNHPYLQAKR